ncbi:nuclear transport factor 2 family protein [uncultured Croceitalea sp.]|uniref:nuclear transport factor 2 family protein n=1 Tax=uncultured Croceitalea sp. TaxID=1798908 RepID=UPI003305D28D
MTEERLYAFAKAWSDKNTERVLEYFTEDCVYEPSIVMNQKKAYKGKVEVSKAVGQLMAFDDTISSMVNNIHINGNFGYWEWEYVDANEGKIYGCDVFEFRDEFIVKKNAYRKLNS